MIKPNITKSATSGVYGFVDSIDEKGISGWILDLDEGVNVVEVYIGGVKVVEKEANLQRPDIDNIIGKITNCGFFVSWREIKLTSEDILRLNKFHIIITHKRTQFVITGNYNYSLGHKVESLQIENTSSSAEISFPRVDKPIVSIIIPCHNKFEYTYNCLKSIHQNTDLQTIEIIIADDNSSDETINIGRYVSGVKVIRNIPALGFLKNCNEASKIARGKYILFLNNDTEVTKGWLEYLLEIIETQPDVGIVGPKLIFPDGKLQEAGGIIWKDASGWNYGRGDDPEKPEYNYVKEVDYISGACILVRRELWDKIGGFDIRYAPAYFEDCDLAFTVRKMGFKVVYQPKSVVVHHEGISHGKDTSTGIKKYQDLNKYKFFEKWKNVLCEEHLENGKDPFLARDRSIFKKHILIIDHYVPEPDKDAGSKTMLNIIKIFKSLGFHVTFIGDNFFRSEPYTSNLQSMGIEVIYGSDYAYNWKQYLKENLKYFDLVFLSRSWISDKYIDYFRELRDSGLDLPKTIFYPQDLSFIRLEREYKATGDMKYLEESVKSKEIEYKIFKEVDATLVLSKYEEALLCNSIKDKYVKFIPGFIFDEQFPISKEDDINKRSGIFFIGGFRHRPNYYGVKWFIENCWDYVKEKLHGIKFYIAGSEIPEDIKQLGSYDRNIEVLGHLSEYELKAMYDKVRVVVAPLTYGAGVKGKVIEAIAHGVPIVTTSIGAEGIPDAEEVTIISDNPIEFSESLIKLYTDSNFWGSIRKKMVEYSKKHLSFENGKRVFIEIIDKVLNTSYGYCNVCGRYTDFTKNSDNLRETYICKFCGSISRNRHLAKILAREISGGKIDNLVNLLRENDNLRVYEAYGSTGAIYNVLQKFDNYVCSEYKKDIPLGVEISKRVYNQDLQNLTFDSCSFDVVITQDVLEHVRDPWVAFKEIYRVLKSNGIHIFTIPYNNTAPTRRRVDNSNGQETFILPPVYHSDSMNPEGALVYTDFGYDLVDILKNFGFETQVYWSTEDDGIYNKIFNNVVFLSKKI
ncbi:MAG: glycosyltransferase [Desulfurococcaceae archaeon]